MQGALFFRKKLLEWNQSTNTRTLPWKNEKDPYRIWLSETMLQQTKASTVIPYYEGFLRAYPTVQHLAKADEKEVFKLWEGLGYYQRCKNMLCAARQMMTEHQGSLPKDYKGVRSLKGVGPYTAAALCSFALNLPYAVLDGNVYRVLSRFWGIQTPIDSREGKAYFETLSNSLLDKKRHALYNQALMDFGATVCTPARPLCEYCTLQTRCRAYQEDKVRLLPIKSRHVLVKDRKMTYILIHIGSEILLRKRLQKDIWQNLYELYEYPSIPSRATTIELFGRSHTIQSRSSKYTQRLTHQLISAYFYTIYLPKFVQLKVSDDTLIRVQKSRLRDFAFPRVIRAFLTQEGLL